MFELFVPAKTFLLGEYYITQQGEAYIINTSPKFKLLCESVKNISSSSSISNIPAESPAGKFIADYPDIFANYSINFIDPYRGLGGFGASTAQFLLAYQAKKILINDSSVIEKLDLLNQYLQYAWNKTGTAPSGADILAQANINSCYVNRATLEVTDFNWPFVNLEFHILHTQNKIATHQHLQQLQDIPNKITANLKTIFQSAKLAIANQDALAFCHVINAYYDELRKFNLVAVHTINLINELRQYSEILAAKGCGALGADTLFVITKPNHTDFINSLCDKFNLIYSHNA